MPVNQKENKGLAVQNINGEFELVFYGLKVPILGLLFFVSKTELDSMAGSVAHIYSVHITPFFSFTFTIPRKKNKNK